MNDVTDYTPGDDPVSIGTTVQYRGGYYEVDAHQDPEANPRPPHYPPLAEAYPDGVAYSLWPANMTKRPDNRDFVAAFVRRTVFRIVSAGPTFGEAP